MKKDREKCDLKDIPESVWDIVKGVNLFQGAVVDPEDSADPMVCSPEINLNESEMAFLKKGPRFMIRNESDIDGFKIEMEKMTVKEKMGASSEGTLDTDESVVTETSLTEEAQNEAAKTAMVYNKSDKALDLGKMKATDYKYNKHVFLPKHETVERESLHDIRRTTMLEAFKEYSKNNLKDKKR